jgi:phosphotransferase system HPr (HPr) family protein
MIQSLHDETTGAQGPLEASAILPNSLGIHARSAALLVRAATRFQASITLQLEERSASARSLTELLRLGARQGHTVWLRAAGSDAEEALGEISAMIENGFGEE